MRSLPATPTASTAFTPQLPSATPRFFATQLLSSPTPAPSPTPTPFPMSIEAMRAMIYLGSEITIEEELDPGTNYRRYYASYRSEGLKIYALLTIPDGIMPDGGWPAIVFNHGYIPPSEYRTTERYVNYVDRLARSGYIVFRIDYRGHDQSEGTPGGAYGDPGYTVDVLNAVASLKQFSQANPAKIGMWGHSLGGFLTLRAMVISPDIKSGVVWAGVTGSYPDLLSKWRRNRPAPAPSPGENRNWRQRWTEQYGTPEQNPQFWASISANSFLSDLSGPIQLHHSPIDPEVPLIFSETLAEEMRAAGKTVELFTYPGDNHNLSNGFNSAMERTITFFDASLK